MKDHVIAYFDCTDTYIAIILNGPELATKNSQDY